MSQVDSTKLPGYQSGAQRVDLTPEQEQEFFWSWVVYDNPKDFPGKFVLRRHGVQLATGLQVAACAATVADSLEEIRAQLPGGLHYLGRYTQDDPAIYEVWI